MKLNCCFSQYCHYYYFEPLEQKQDQQRRQTQLLKQSNNISMEDEDFEDDLTAIRSWLTLASSVAIDMASSDEDTDDKRKIDHRKLPRSKRTLFKHQEALNCINRDYLGPQPLFDDKQFELMFRISPQRFQRLMEDIGNSNFEETKFYINNKSASGMVGAALQAKLLLPLKCLAYGVPAHAFRDYFQMSQTLARECCFKFDQTIHKLYEHEYLRLPTPADLKAITKLHKMAHEVDGMFGSLDCCHTFWKNCPMGWQGSFQGKEGKPSIVLEAITDYHLWFWQVSYGYAGTLNDLNILNLSPFLQSLLDGRFEGLEAEAGVVPYNIAGSNFSRLFVLVDGIYPKYSRFVRGFKEPTNQAEQYYTRWQEGARKDVERAFGVLQAKFQFIARPIHLHHLKDIANRVASCIILHNMCVADRVMGGDVYATYTPSATVEETSIEEAVEQPEDLLLVQQQQQQQQQHEPPEDDDDGGAGIGVSNSPTAIQNFIVTNARTRFKALRNKEDHNKLLSALIRLKTNY